MSNTLYPDQAGHSVGPDLGSNCLQRLSADNNQYTGNELRGQSIELPNKGVIVFISSNSVDPYKMPHSAAFHWGLTVCHSTHLGKSYLMTICMPDPNSLLKAIKASRNNKGPDQIAL